MRVNPGLVSPARRAALASVKRVYAAELSPHEIELAQLRRFNAVWQWSILNRRFYQHWQSTHRLPTVLRSVAELDEFPILTKQVIREHETLVFAESDTSRTYSTGGSTAEPTIFPRGRSELPGQYADNYVGRSWWGISPTDARALVWGHSHLYGVGWRSSLNRANRSLRDRLTNTLRLDGYRISSSDSRHHLERILRFAPTHIVGYSSALHRIAIEARPEDSERLSRLNLKGVIATSETLTVSEARVLEETFRCPVIIEYGAAETGVIAVSRADTWSIRVLWHSHLLRDHKYLGARISTLNARQFPLINYSLGDVLVANEGSPLGNVLGMGRIVGRDTETVAVRTTNGGRRTISALQLTHILKGLDAVRAVQFSQGDPDIAVIYIELRTGRELSDVQTHLLRILADEYPDLDQSAIVVRQEQNQQYTQAGKHRVMRVEEL